MPSLGCYFSGGWWPACPGRAALTEFCPSRDCSQNRLAISSGSISGLVTFHHFGFAARAVQPSMMGSAQRHRKFVADFAAYGLRLRKSQVMSI